MLRYGTVSNTFVNMKKKMYCFLQLKFCGFKNDMRVNSRELFGVKLWLHYALYDWVITYRWMIVFTNNSLLENGEDKDDKI